MKQAFQLLLCLMCSITLSACSDNHQKNIGKYKPIVNPNPKYFVTISGKYTLPKNKIWFVAKYNTENSNCYKLVSELEGAYSARAANVYYSIVPNKKYYSLKIPTEHYFPGKCQWRLETISYVYGNKDAYLYSFPDLIAFSAAKGLYKKAVLPGIEMSCKSGVKDCRFIGSQSWMPNLSRNKNYKITINITG